MVLCFLGLFVLVGIASLTYATYQTIRALDARHWPTAEAVVLSSDMTTHFDTSDGVSGGGGPTFGAAVTYSYSVDGIGYESDRVSFGSYSSSDSDHAETILARYPVGASVTVHYDPEDPAEAVLEPGYAGGHTIIFIVGGTFVAVGSLLFWFIARVAMRRG